jgi:hypothetical protein
MSIATVVGADVRAMGQNYMLVNTLGQRITSIGSNGYFRTREWADVTAEVLNSGRNNLQWNNGLPFARNQPSTRDTNGNPVGMGYHAYVRVSGTAQVMIHSSSLSGLMDQYRRMVLPF